MATTDISTEVVRTPLDYLPHRIDPKAVEQALLIGDLSKMSDEVRIAYYVATCRSVGLNPLTKPFQALSGDDGKISLYPDKGCAEQLRKLHRVSVKVIGREFLNDLYIVTVQARTPDGREEESQGVVPIAKAKGTWEQTREGKRYFKAAVDTDGREITIPLSVAERANALKRAETQAKRRVTLAICGLGMPDWEGEPGQAAHPMSLTLQAPTPATLEENIALLYGDPQTAPAGNDGAEYLAQIEAAILAKPDGDLERGYRWAEKRFGKARTAFTLDEYREWLTTVRETQPRRPARSAEPTPEQLNPASTAGQPLAEDRELFAGDFAPEERGQESAC